MPQHVRERKGSFFTPKIWVEKSQEYLEKVFGADWQDEYYIWDCCCGTGNLLAGLVNPDNIWASTLDQPDVDIVHTNIDEGFNLLKPHVFQFDFLSDEFMPQSKGGKIPDALYKILSHPEKQKKLIIYINPPYAEATSAKTVTGTGQNKAGVATGYRINNELKPLIGKATNELSALFFGRIYRDMQGCQLATFSKLAFVCNQNYTQFRRFFRAKFNSGFIIQANTFDNVNGQFLIGFTVWDTAVKKTITQIKVDVMGNDRNLMNAWKAGTKRFFAAKGNSINVWLSVMKGSTVSPIGFLSNYPPDFQNQKQVRIQNKGMTRSGAVLLGENNLVSISIYFAVRHCIGHHWTNDRDQFLCPNDGYKKDKRFQNDCLMFTLFHHQNRITTQDGINHWLPFTRKDVKAKDSFVSDFMYRFVNERGKFGKEAEAVFAAGKDLWTYYHATIKDDDNADVNASLYDIRAYFKGRKNGRVNSKSSDEKFTELDKALKTSLSALAEQIQPKVYEYGFLLK
ncbi:hypothetical protein FACS189419_08030 [Planctomycetales bacterium]|nr:hypothetical protein FACS189419_08030 [Planctomycetales bacterium]